MILIGAQQEGIFRTNCSLSQLNLLKAELTVQGVNAFVQNLRAEQDIILVASLFKSLLSDLPEPLLKDKSESSIRNDCLSGIAM